MKKTLLTYGVFLSLLICFAFFQNKKVTASAPVNNHLLTDLAAVPPQPGNISGSDTVCESTSSIVYSIDPVAGATGYTWAVPPDWTITSGENTNAITVTSGIVPGTKSISVIATNADGSSPTRTKTVVVLSEAPGQPDPISGNTVVCLGDTQTYEINSVPNASSYTWTVPEDLIIISQSGTSITVLVGFFGGTISVVANNGCGSSTPRTLLIEVSLGGVLQQPSGIDGNEFVYPGNTETYTLTLDAGFDITKVSYFSWTVPSDWTIISGQGDTAITVEIGQAGFASISVAAVNHCGEVGSPTEKNIAVYPGVEQPGPISGDTTVCLGDTRSYFINAVPSATSYAWTVPGDWTIISSQIDTSITVIIGSLIGEISVIARNSYGNSDPQELQITVSTVIPSQPGAISGDDNMCAGQNLTYNINFVPNATEYIWTVPGDWTIVSGQGSTTLNVISGALSGDITVVAATGCGSSAASTKQVTIIGSPPPQAGLINGNDDICLGTIDKVYSINALPSATSYTWTVPADWTITSGQGDTAITVTADSTSGDVSVIASNSCGDSPSQTKYVLISTAIPAQPDTITGKYQACLSTPGNTYSINSVPGATSYLWTVPSGWTITSGQGDTSIIVTAGTAGGDISVTAVNDCGSSPEQTKSVTVVPGSLPPQPGAITGSDELCSGVVGEVYSINSVTDATTYLWSVPADWIITSGQGDTSITVTVGATSGDITVMAINSCGNSPAQAKNVLASTGVPSQPGIINGDEELCSGATGIAYNINAVTGATSYLWTVPADWTITSGQGDTAITVTAGNINGDVSVTASNACGSSASQSKSVAISTVIPSQPGAINGNTTTCSGKNLTYNIASVPDATEYIWAVPGDWTIVSGQGSTTLNVISGSISGNVTVAAATACGSSPVSTKQVTITGSPPLQPGLINGNDDLCSGATTGKVYSINAVPGATSYTWTVPADWTITSIQGDTAVTVTAGSTSGDVSVIATNLCGDSPSQTKPIVVNTTSPPQPGLINGNDDLCLGATGKIYSINAVPGAASYTWTVPADWIIESGQGNTAIAVTAGSTPGEVSVIASNACGNSPSQTKYVLISTAIPAQPGTITGKYQTCSGIPGNTYSINAVPGATSYLWTVPSGWTITSGQGDTSIIVIAGATGGDISVAAVNDCGSSPERTKSVTIVPGSLPPQPGAITGSDELCSGDVGKVYSINPVTGATSYAWSVPGDWLITSQSSMAITITAGSTSGDVSVIATNLCGNSPPQTKSVVVNTTSPPQPGAIVGNGDLCLGATGKVYSINAVSGATSYTWTVPADWTIGSGQGDTAITVTAGSTPGDVSVIASNACGNSPSQTKYVLISTAIPAQPGTITGKSQPCSLIPNNTYSINPVAVATSYLWTVPVGWIITSGQGNTSIIVTAGATGGDISVAAVNDCGSSLAQTKSVIVVPGSLPPQPGVITGSDNLCSGDVGKVYSISSVADATGYIWSVPGGWTITSVQGDTAIIVTAGSTSGDVTVIASNLCGDSPSQTKYVLISTAIPAQPGTITGKYQVCSGVPGNTYSINAVQGATGYLWTVPSGWTITSGQGDTTIIVTSNTTGGDISVSAVNGCGGSLAQTKSVIVVPGSLPPQPGAINGVDEVCAGAAGITYHINTVTDATSYTWTVPADWIITSGQGDTAIIVTAGALGGDISVTANNDCGSSAAQNKAITIGTVIPAQPGAINGNDTLSSGVAGNVYSINAVAGATSYTWTVPAGWTITSGQVGASITVTPGTLDGDVTVAAMNACGASSAVSKTVVIMISPSFTLQPVSTAANVGDTVVFTVGADGAGISYQWETSTDQINWVTLTNTGIYAGVTTPTLTLNGVTEANDSIFYRCVASNSWGASVSSDTVQLSVAYGGNYPISGYVKYPRYSPSGDSLYDIGIRLDSVWIYLNQNGTKIDSALTDTNGYYEFSPKPSGIYTISGFSQKETSGVNATDAAQARGHYLDYQKINQSIRWKAADVNNSNFVNSTDIQFIVGTFVGYQLSFNRGRFVLENYFGNDTVMITNDVVDLDLWFLFVGDVYCSGVPPQGEKGAKLTVNQRETTPKEYSAKQQSVEIPVIISNKTIDAGAISLILKYPGKLITISDVRFALGSGSPNDYYSYNLIGDELRIGWCGDNIKMTQGTEVFTIIANMNAGVNAGDIAIKLKPDYLNEFADEKGNVYENIEIKIPSINITTTSIEDGLSGDNNSIICNPNPFNEKGIITVKSQPGSELRLALYNATGQLLKVFVDGDNVSETTHYIITGDQLPMGIYHLEAVWQNQGIATKKSRNIIIAR